MKVFYTQLELKNYISEQKNNIIGFVPTMGALHKGHLSLVEKAKELTDFVVVSIFANPTQFDNKTDLEKYPRTLEKDIELLTSINCDVVYAPSVADIYNDNVVAEKFEFDGLEHQMEGKFRDGHFDGVGTIVKKLFEIVRPNLAFFGEKDFQQLQIIKKMVEKHQLPIKIVGCEIFRENDGLAMSSRNVRLSKTHREEAPFIYKTLQKAKEKFKTHSPEETTNWVRQEFDKNELLELEYFTIANTETLITTIKKEAGKKYRAFIAVYAGEIRLIDNIKL